MKKDNLDHRVRMTREWTFQALTSLLETMEFKDIKIKDITIKAGISRSTFYRNFYSIEDIIKYKIEEFFNDYFQDLNKYFESRKHENEMYAVELFINKVDKESEMIMTIINTNQEQQMIDGIMRLINKHIHLFYSERDLKKKETSYIMEMVASSSWALLRHWHIRGKIETKEELQKIYLESIKQIYISIHGSIKDIVRKAIW